MAAPLLLVLGFACALGWGRPADAHTWLLMVAALGLLLLSATLSAAETALFSLESDQIETLERQGRPRILALKTLLLSRDETLTTIRVAVYAANLAFVACVLGIVSRKCPGRPLWWAGLGGLGAAGCLIVFGELLPRAWGRRRNEAVALGIARPLIGLTVIAAPLRWPVLTAARVLLRLANEPLEEAAVTGEGDLQTVMPAADKGGLEKGERELISGVVEFGSMTAADIMTPRPEIVAFPDATLHEELLARVARLKFRRVLIYHETMDQVRGLLHVKDLLLNPETDYREFLRKPLLVPENKNLMELLREFRRKRVHLAVVCDEFGRTAGLVTLDDLLDEIIGELADEGLRGPQTIRCLDAKTWLVLGRTNLADLRERVGLELADDAGRTLSGFVATRLGRIPQAGDAVAENGFVLTVERVAARRASILRVERTEPPPAEGGEEARP